MKKISINYYSSLSPASNRVYVSWELLFITTVKRETKKRIFAR